jgi:SAM-dependent methyltransferase
VLVLPNKASTRSALDDFAARETNRALLTRTSVADALLLLHENGLPLHNDTPKNWDTLLALYHAVRTTPQNALVLDAGAETYSSFLPCLAKLGFTNLLGVNLTFDASRVPVRVGPIEFRHGDIEALTELADNSFGFAASLSVIEHGVDLPRFFGEMGRVLVPGGHLYISTDYWGPGLDTSGIEAYGVAFRTFDAGDILRMEATAAAAGLLVTGPIGTEVAERVVHWKRMDLRYTFHNLLFLKPGPR